MVRPRDSNPRPPAPKADALPTELSRRCYGVQPGSIWVPYGLAHVNKIKQIVESEVDPGFLDKG